MSRCTIMDENLISQLLVQHDDQKVKDYGVSLAISMVNRLTTEATIPGVHLCTLNLEKSVQRVISELGWSFPNCSKSTNKLITVSFVTK